MQALTNRKDACMVIEDEATGRAKGGVARAEILSPEERSAIAKKGAVGRWGAKATHKGNFKDEFGIDVDCYVLDDDTKTAVISQSGMGKALGLSDRGNAFPRFLSSNAMSNALSAELQEKIQKPLKFQWDSGSAGTPPVTVHGYDVTILIDICNAILRVESDLTKNQAAVGKQARIILSASAKNGIKDLVYALARYNRTAEEVISAFKMYVQEEARTYEREFPNELYIQWHRLFKIPVPVRGKPWHFKHLTVNHIWTPLANSNGKILELTRIMKAKDGDRQKKLFQFLNIVGARALSRHIGRVLEMCESSKTKEEYERRITERFGAQQEFNLVMPDPANAS
jgi:hypothetical protein